MAKILQSGLIILLLFCSCSPERKLANFEVKHKDALANYCAETYPAKIGEPKIIHSVELIRDTVPANCDSLAAAILAANPGIGYGELIKLLGEHSIVTNNYHTRDSVIIEVLDSAVIATLNNKIDALTKLVQSWEIKAEKNVTGRNTWMWVAIGLAVLVALIIFIILKTKFGIAKK